ncbi:hypothetical protein ACHAXR_010107 [Thalassiosira sp. AJA248-18]
MGEEVVTGPSERRSARLLSLFGKGGKNSKAGKDSKSTSIKSQTLFDKSGKGTKSAKDGNNWVDEPHKIFAKSKKGSSAKAGKSGGVGPAFDKAGKSKTPKSVLSDPTTESINISTPNTSNAGSTNNNPSPTPRPTCKSNTVQDDFNLCIAIDGSGSVCSGDFPMQCLRCFPNVVCQDRGVDQDTCCRNFADVKEFSSLVVNSLADELPTVDKSFSVVQFSKDAAVESELSSATQTLLVLDGIEYFGGYTNHASAIEACKRTFSSTIADSRQQFILLVTDGVSTWPEGNPEGTAEVAAMLAKEDEIVIIPIFISAKYDEDDLAFMRRLSSNDKVFDVTDFESLNSLQESLVNTVSCS